ncbi:MAG: hypothetical protein A2987_00845 [Omnitrophica bacterium RIFCSPLOWO2_01_FULL_45_10]|nr:MAG: hypothetical protein A2987_00845 [Omnitrophica bacterium RIFCSPLOWO2_01_FULL_45_10]
MSVLKVNDLRVHFRASAGMVKAVDGVAFEIEKGECLGLVGESGSGKTLTALSIMKLIPENAKIAAGEILFHDINLLALPNDHMRGIRGSKIALVFQESGVSLDPVFTIGHQMTEALFTHRRLVNRKEAKEIALEYLNRVHIPDPLKTFYDYPHQLSGGAKQRVGIAISLLNSPELLILDEPTTALDVTIQAQILDLLDEIIERHDISVLFISHDFGIIARMADRVAVMRNGKIVEMGMKNEILSNPKDPYTVNLLESVKALSWR